MFLYCNSAQNMKTLFKILTMPIWLPIKILWFTSKVLAFIFLVLVLAGVIYFFFILR